MVGLMLDRYHSDHPRGGYMGSGVAVAAETRVGQTTSVRAVVSGMSGFSFADDISVCYNPTPDGHCLPDAHFAHRLWGIEALAVVRPRASFPIALVVGPGAIWGVGARKGVSDSPSIDTTLGGPRATLRAGVELTLGTSPHAPLLHWSRTMVSSHLLSMTHISTLGLVFRIH